MNLSRELFVRYMLGIIDADTKLVCSCASAVSAVGRNGSKNAFTSRIKMYFFGDWIANRSSLTAYMLTRY